jgi:hypothetical protein
VPVRLRRRPRRRWQWACWASALACSVARQASERFATMRSKVSLRFLSRCQWSSTTVASDAASVDGCGVAVAGDHAHVGVCPEVLHQAFDAALVEELDRSAGGEVDEDGAVPAAAQSADRQSVSVL